MLKIWKGKWKEESGSSNLDSTGNGKRQGSDTLTPARPFKKQKTKNSRVESPVIGFPTESIVVYDPSPRHHSQSLAVAIRHATKDHPFFVSYSVASQRIEQELGLSAADLYWKRALADIENALPLFAEGEDLTTRMRVKARDTLNNWTFSMPNLNIYSLGFNVSPKYLRLVQSLKACEPLQKGFRAIVFVSDKFLAQAILDLMRATAELEVFRSQILAGDESPEQQDELFRAFASGTYNLFVAPASTEDLETPRASLIVRFSLSNHYLSHAYTYSHSQGADSHIISMAEKENADHRFTLELLSKMSDDMKLWGLEGTFSLFPPSTAAQMKPFTTLSRVESKEDPHLTDPVTGARIYPTDVTLLVYRVGAQLREQSPTMTTQHLRIEYDTMETDSGPRFVCRIALPGTLESVVSGELSLSKGLARRDSCYKLCSELLKAGLLDHRLVVFSTNLHSEPPSMPPLSEKETGTREYSVKRPSFWRNYSYSFTSTLYPTVICAGSINADSRLYSPLVLFTRDPLVELPPIHIYFGAEMETVPLLFAKPMAVNEQQLDLLNKYTLRIYRLTTNKRERCSADQMSFFLAPLSCDWVYSDAHRKDGLLDITDSICWTSISLAAGSWVSPLKYGSKAVVSRDIVDAVIQDRAGEYTRRYDNFVVRGDMSPLSRPENIQADGATGQSLLEYIQSHSTSFQGLEDEKQCIIQILETPLWFDHLNPAYTPPDDSAKNTRYIIPELGSKCTVPASVYRTGFLMPSILRRIDEFLLVKELNGRLFSHSISEDLLIKAITAPSVNYEYNYERLELLGDAFLKYVSSIYVFVVHPEHEGVLHTLRTNLISNASLLSRAVRVGLPQYIHARPPLLKIWCPPNFTSDEDVKKVTGDKDTSSQVAPKDHSMDDIGEGNNLGKARRKKAKKRVQNSWVQSPMQWLGDKTVADVSEAIIGAAYLTGGRDLCLQITKDLGVPLNNIKQWSDFARSAILPSPKVTASMTPSDIKAVEDILGYKFKKQFLLAQALTHHTHKGASYERLEFLGDALLDFVIIRNIYREDEDLSPGALTILKSAMVSNNTLAALCVDCGLHKYLLLQSPTIANAIQQYAILIQKKKREEYAASETESRMPGQYWLNIEPPKPLADIIESVIAAAYITENFITINGPDVIYTHLLKPFYDRHISLQTLAHHPTKTLYERLHGVGCRGIQINKSTLTKNGIPSHRCSVHIHGKLLGSNEDRHAAVAARTASVCAVAALEKDMQFFKRHCTC